MRRVARERVFQLVFEYSFYRTPNDTTLELMSLDSGLNEDDRLYMRQVYFGVISEYETLKQLISKYVRSDSPSEKFHRTDYYILIIAAYELIHRTAPDATVIDEAVELAKKYGVAQSGRLVNGVLASVLRELRGQNPGPSYRKISEARSINAASEELRSVGEVGAERDNGNKAADKIEQNGSDEQ